MPSHHMVDDAYQLARTHGGSVYDAIYIRLAEQESLPIVTNDTQLAATARAVGLQAWVVSESLPATL